MEFLLKQKNTFINFVFQKIHSKQDQYWKWNGNEYNAGVRKQHGTGFGATFFYHALGDLKNFIELKMKAGSKYTLVSLGVAEKFDDSNEVTLNLFLISIDNRI